jgi:hypothetical protein
VEIKRIPTVDSATAVTASGVKLRRLRRRTENANVKTDDKLDTAVLLDTDIYLSETL